MQRRQVEVDGVPIHFLRKPGVGPNPTPLILTHGWPWTFWHWSKVIDQLADPAAYGGCPAEGAAELWTLNGLDHLIIFKSGAPLWSWLSAHARP